MPRRPVEKTVEHRLTLGTYERNLLTSALKEERKNDLQTAAITSAGNVVGSVVGSGALLWAVGLYLGYNVIDTAVDKTKIAIGRLSTTYANILTEFTGGLTKAERNFFKARFDELDALIVANRERDINHARALDVLVQQAKDGTITYAEFQTLGAEWSTENDLINQDREDILEARETLLQMQARAIAPTYSIMNTMKSFGGRSGLAYFITSTYPKERY